MFHAPGRMVDVCISFQLSVKSDSSNLPHRDNIWEDFIKNPVIGTAVNCTNSVVMGAVIVEAGTVHLNKK
jgi:hypothetical protein